jgi:phage shock protein PspC (stress-responsive transcriptional regulator)
MTTSNPCLDTVEALRHVIQDGTPPPDALRRHWSSCPRCRATVRATTDLLDQLEATADDSEASSDDELYDATAATSRATQAADVFRLRTVRLRLAVVAVVAGAGLAIGVATLTPMLGTSVWETVAAVAILTLLVGAPCALAITIARAPQKLGLSKRLAPGFQLSGVCVGLAERTGTPVWPWRLGFVVLALWGGKGVWLYLLLDLVMPLHPEDRQHLLRFRVARWLRRLWRPRLALVA